MYLLTFLNARGPLGSGNRSGNFSEHVVALRHNHAISTRIERVTRLELIQLVIGGHIMILGALCPDESVDAESYGKRKRDHGDDNAANRGRVQARVGGTTTMRLDGHGRGCRGWVASAYDHDDACGVNCRTNA